MKLERVNVTSMEMLDELYNGSALTWEGLDTSDESLELMWAWIHALTPIKNRNTYIVKGRVMNEHYMLTGSNRYQDDLNIVCVKLSSLYDPSKVVIPRFEVEGRWFDDIVDNNARREGMLVEVEED